MKCRMAVSEQSENFQNDDHDDDSTNDVDD